MSKIIDPQKDREARALENPNIPLGSPEVWNEVFGDTSTEAGEAVSPKRALQYAPVWQAVNLISGDVAKLPFNVYRRRPDLGERGREIDESHPVQKLLRYKSNGAMSAYKFWRRMMTHVLIWNNAYALIDYQNGLPVALLPLLPDRTSPQIQPDGSIVFVSEVGGTLHGFNASQVLHFEGVSVYGEADCELVYKARNSFALGLAAEKFASKFFANGARIGGVLEVPAGMTKTAADNLETGFRKTYENVSNSFKTVILRDSAKFHTGQFTPEQSQLVSARQEQVRDVARWYNLPPHKLGDFASSASYSSLEQENRSYLDSCLSAWLHTIASECYLKLLTLEQQENNTHFIEHNTGALIAADIKTQYEVGRMGIEMGVLSPDEFRAMQNQNPRGDGLGNKFLKPLNMSFADDKEEEAPEPAPAPAAPEEAPAEVEEDSPTELVRQQLQRYRGVEEDSEEAQQAARAALERSLVAATEKTLNTVNRWARQKTPAAFVNHVDNRLKDEATLPIVARIRDSLSVFAALNGGDSEQIAKKVACRWLEIVQNDLNKTLETTTEDNLQAAIANRCEQLKTKTVTLWEIIDDETSKR